MTLCRCVCLLQIVQTCKHVPENRINLSTRMRQWLGADWHRVGDTPVFYLTAVPSASTCRCYVVLPDSKIIDGGAKLGCKQLPL